MSVRIDTKALADTRERLGLSQEETALFLAISPKYVSALENGSRKQVSKAVASKITQFCNSPPAEAQIDRVKEKLHNTREYERVIREVVATSDVVISHAQESLPNKTKIWIITARDILEATSPKIFSKVECNIRKNPHCEYHYLVPKESVWERSEGMITEWQNTPVQIKGAFTRMIGDLEDLGHSRENLSNQFFLHELSDMTLFHPFYKTCLTMFSTDIDQDPIGHLEIEAGSSENIFVRLSQARVNQLIWHLKRLKLPIQTK